VVWITLLKGVNVGGNNVIKMERLRTILARRGLGTVKTYIQSGNILCGGPDRSTVCAVIKGVLAEDFQITCDGVTLPADALSNAVDAQPFGDVDPKQVHLYFPCTADTFVNTDHLRAEAKAAEQIAWDQGVLFMHTPGGFGRSPLAAKLPRLVSAPFTARNLNTCTKLADMAGALALGDL